VAGLSVSFLLYYTYLFVNGVLLCFVNSHSRIDRYEESGIHQMKCMDCLLKYAGKRAEHFTPDTKNIYREFFLFFYFADRFTALHFTATGAPLAVRRIRTFPMNEHARWQITFVMKGSI
jgi:hypothetical protein